LIRVKANIKKVTDIFSGNPIINTLIWGIALDSMAKATSVKKRAAIMGADILKPIINISPKDLAST